ncbi:glycosyltransferase family 2 protein [Sulfuricurvum sp.]|uniref:glycosyltransferase family 2 protein n=1 Tax=Sulfuricurvum sp. TaxID=2025608 RepID=UPI00261D18F9|nr:glycosyltransferase family 2 protein [Sulfuricurvum sp.]MDD2838809.1 glycosyltransferase family 2 protein [Sulfuricurvum sp.]MDD3597869.1 glycosyltransferase family 2 protein [Sulfuricurvum sp.]MDD4883204.1 glycosyltransferase family 2 protein [Sulfuricurvum sp.]
MIQISVVVPFYNPPLHLFAECLRALKKLNPYEVILVDDCSTDARVVNLAKSSGFIYLTTPYQSGYDGMPHNLGVQHATGDCICRVDSDDVLLELPETMEEDIHFGRLNRVKAPVGITIEELILAPRAIYNGLVTTKEIWQKYPLAEDSNVYGDILFALRVLHNRHTFTVHPNINYIYHKHPASIQNSKPQFYHRLRQVQTVARFCQLENIEPIQAIHYLEMAMMNVRHGSNSLKLFHKNNASDSSKDTS